MDTLLGVLAVLAFSWCVVVVLLVRGARALRRAGAGLRDRAALALRAQGAGPMSEVARLRRELDRSLGGARSALRAARAVDAPVGDVPSLLARLELAARAVDGELRLLESQPDPRRAAAGLAGPRSRATAVVESAADLVDGLLHATRHADGELAAVQAACALEAEALRSLARRQVSSSDARSAG